jgi:hypothetical protein
MIFNPMLLKLTFQVFATLRSHFVQITRRLLTVANYRTSPSLFFCYFPFTVGAKLLEVSVKQ